MGCVWAQNLCMEKFRLNSAELLEEWGRVPPNIIEIPNEPQVSVLQIKRAEKAQRDLERWLRKMKLAQTKVRKLRQRVNYYDKRQAAQKAI